MVTEIVDFIGGGLFNIINLFLGLLPSFSLSEHIDLSSSSLLADVMGWFNWFVPVQTLATIAGLWVAALVLYQAYLDFGGFFTKFTK